MALERLQKIIAAAGIASRRKAEELIQAGLVSVNGATVTELGTKADPETDSIRVQDKLLHGPERHEYVALNKPRGYVTTVSDPEGRPTVMELLRSKARLYPVGRLDFNSEGLLLLTNDGDLAHKLMKAASHIPKTYLVKVAGQPGEDQLRRLRAGVTIAEERDPNRRVRTAPAQIRVIKEADNPWLEVTLHEGRNRQIRKMFEEIGHHVEKIRRVRYGPLELDLPPGESRILTSQEITKLQRATEPQARPQFAGAASSRLGANRRAAGAQFRGRNRESEAQTGEGRGERAIFADRRPGRDAVVRPPREERAERRPRPDSRSERPGRPSQFGTREGKNQAGERPPRRFDRPRREDFRRTDRGERRPKFADRTGTGSREQRPAFSAHPRQDNRGKGPNKFQARPGQDRGPKDGRDGRDDSRPRFADLRSNAGERRPRNFSDKARSGKRPRGPSKFSNRPGQDSQGEPRSERGPRAGGSREGRTSPSRFTPRGRSSGDKRPPNRGRTGGNQAKPNRGSRGGRP
ncbi:MAG: pseudouridine synthase [Terriglobales bacterium]